MTAFPCPTCGAPLKSRHVYGSYTHEIWACGAESDDGPGKRCPYAKSPEPVQNDDPSSETMEEVAIEPETVTPTETLPAVLTAAEITEARLQEIESWGKYVVSDPSDKDGAKRAGEVRRRAKAVRTEAARICNAERDEAKRQNQWWLDLRNAVVARIEPVEAHLQAIEDDHARIVTEAKRKADEAAQAKMQGRLNEMAALGLPPDLIRAQHATDTEWDAWIEMQREIVTTTRAAQARADELTALGDECTLAEALELTTEQSDHRLEVARKAKHDRDEADRLRAEAETKKKAEQAERERQERETARKRLELGSQRLHMLLLLGLVDPTQDQLADLSEESFERIRLIAVEAKANRDRLAKEQAEELARLREEDRKRTEAANTERARLDRIAEAQQAEDMRKEPARQDPARRDRLEPSIRRALVWLGGLRDVPPVAGMEMEPEVLEIVQDYADRHAALVDKVVGKLRGLTEIDTTTGDAS